MSRVCPLYSGSTGNSTYIGTSNGGIMIDAGASCKGLSAAIESAGGYAEEIKLVAVTHEHSDHIKGLKTFLKKSKAVLLASTDTLEKLIDMNCVPQGTKAISLDRGSIDIFGIEITRFPTSHDCEGSSGYSFILPDENKISVCTDLGIVTGEVRNCIYGSNLVLFESNHDLKMLEKGPYPAMLKRRIMSDCGHLSNNASAAELPDMLKKGTTRFVLGHLSQKNNIPMLAENAATATLMDIGAKNSIDYILKVAKPCDNGVISL